LLEPLDRARDFLALRGRTRIGLEEAFEVKQRLQRLAQLVVAIGDIDIDQRMRAQPKRLLEVRQRFS